MQHHLESFVFKRGLFTNAFKCQLVLHHYVTLTG